MAITEVGRKEFFDNLDTFINSNIPVKISDFHHASHSSIDLNNITEFLQENVVSEQIHYSKLAEEFAGRYFYNDRVNALNFEHHTCSISEFFNLLKDTKKNKSFYAAQAIPLNIVFNNYVKDTFQCRELKADVDARLWLGNKCNTAAHFDFSHNIAHVLKGRREFKLFPTHQIQNLYVGPISLTPGGTPISMVDVVNPDFDKFPRYEVALQHAVDVALEPGQAVFIPNLWWHAVQSLDSENILLNYWWKELNNEGSLPYDSLVFLMSFIPSLPIQERKAWKEIFNYYVFQTETDPKSHLPGDLHDILMNLSHNDLMSIRTWFKGKL